MTAIKVNNFGARATALLLAGTMLSGVPVAVSAQTAPAANAPAATPAAAEAQAAPVAAPVWVEREQVLRAGATGLFYPAVAKGQMVAMQAVTLVARSKWKAKKAERDAAKAAAHPSPVTPPVPIPAEP